MAVAARVLSSIPYSIFLDLKLISLLGITLHAIPVTFISFTAVNAVNSTSMKLADVPLKDLLNIFAR